MGGKITRTTACKACGAEIAFVKTYHMGRIPIDTEPVWVKPKSGGKPFVRLDGTMVIGYQVGDACEDPDVEEAYISHFATCQDADRMRKRRRS